LGQVILIALLTTSIKKVPSAAPFKCKVFGIAMNFCACKNRGFSHRSKNPKVNVGIVEKPEPIVSSPKMAPFSGGLMTPATGSYAIQTT
jgi:hypothetical protein